MAPLSRLGKFFVNRLNERNSRRFFYRVRDHLALDKHSSCLEIGCGKGFLSYLVYEHYRPGRLVVTDYDPAQVEEARALFQNKLRALPTNVEFRYADALDLPFEDESFDGVFAMVGLHHTEGRDWRFRNIPRALDEVRRVLRPGGWFAYEEVFNKSSIRAFLASHGFRRIVASRRFLIADFCVYERLMEKPDAAEPVGSG